MTLIKIKELATPEALVMKRIAQSVGLNLRPQRAVYDSTSKIWNVPIKAIIPSQVSTKGKPIKTFIYRFENITRAELTGYEDEYKFLKFPKAKDIENQLYGHWTDLTQKLIQEILKVGEPVWGQLTYVQMFLRPLYSIILHTLTNRRLTFSDIKTQGIEKYVQFLAVRGYLDEDLERGEYKASNNLTVLEQHLFVKYRDETTLSDFFVTGQIVGVIFAKYYNELKTELHAFAPGIYVDTSTAYYIDAVRADTDVSMTELDLWKKARMISNRSARDPSISYPTVISEIVAGKILSRNDEGMIYANENVFKRLRPLREELAQEICEV